MNRTVLKNRSAGSFIFKDPRPLEEDFIPHKIQHRDRQIENIKYHLSGLIRYGSLMNNIIIYGPPGTGKTHSVENVLRNLGQDLNAFYSRAYRSISGHSFFRGFLEKNLNLHPHPRESISVYYAAFEEKIRKMKNVLVVFDDIQYLLYGDPKGLDGLLFYLSRLEKNLGIILIGNIRVNDLCEALDPPTTSSLKLRSVYFPKYNAPQLNDILIERAHDALTEKALELSIAAISRIAAKTAQGWGSARYALDLLKEAGLVSEAILDRNYIPEEAVERAEDMIETNGIEDQIRSLPQQPLAVFEAVYRLKDKKDLSTGDVYSTYGDICKERGLDSFTLRKVSDIITELDSSGLICCRLVSGGRYGRTRLISWPSNPVLENVYMREREVL